MTEDYTTAFGVERAIPRDQRQAMIASWAELAFSRAQATSIPQRGLRLLEEAIEAFQACGGDEALAHKLVKFVFERPKGTVGQELGGVAVTVLALAAAAGLSADEEECREIHRVLNKPLGEFTQRNADKNAAGFLMPPDASTEGSCSRKQEVEEAIARQDADIATWYLRPQSSTVEAPPKRNSCCANSGTHGEGGREYCSTCGQEVT